MPYPEMQMIGSFQFSFPYDLKQKREVVSILAMATSVVLFLLVFEPYGTDDFVSRYRFVFLTGYGVIFAVVFLIFSFVTPILHSTKFSAQRWTLGHQLVWIFCQFLLTTLLWYTYWGWFFSEPLSFTGWGRFILIALSVAFFPLTLYFLGAYISLLQRNLHDILHTNNQISKWQAGESRSRQIEIVGDLDHEKLSLCCEQLLFLKAARNYVEVFFLVDSEPGQQLLRGSLSRIQSQLKLPFLVRCHRSYVVNLHNIVRVSGNSQNVQLHMKDAHCLVPVSRGQIKTVLRSLDEQIESGLQLHK